MNAHTLSDGALAKGWLLVVRGIEYHQLDGSELDELIEHIRAGQDYIADELGFEFMNGVLRVSLLDQTEMCPPELMLTELEALRREHHTAGSPDNA